MNSPPAEKKIAPPRQRRQVGWAARKTGKAAECRPAILPIASSCCTEVSRHISRGLLERVNSCRIQRADGDCDLAAVILHVKRRRICVSPHNHAIKKWMKAQTAKKNGKGNLCHKKKPHDKRNNNRAHQGRHRVYGHKTPY
ncbi:C-C motif chemokine 28 isoform X1 [Microcebus murinus]|uniref:C-C motif chemokine 28 isoform X1 n=1 Tax=Microcebus murinus TaxID=30608 RepID=UPI003F6D65C0